MSRSTVADVTVSLSISSTVPLDYRFLAASLSTFSRRRDRCSRPRRLVMSDTRGLQIAASPAVSGQMALMCFYLEFFEGHQVRLHMHHCHR